MIPDTWIRDPGIHEQLAEVEELLVATAAQGGRLSPLYAQLTSRRAKRLRPALCFLAARFGSSRPSAVLVRAAAGLEMLHEATLYHDDIVDEAECRRGEPTAQHNHGSAAAALAGSELLYATAEYFTGLAIPLRRAIARAVEALCRGQLREVETMGGTDVSVRARVRVMRDKTARLFGLACHLGAALSDADAQSVWTLRRFGLRFGLCFQLADDIRDLTSSSDLLGRHPGADVRDGVYSLPVLFGLHSGTPAAERLRCSLWELQLAGGARPTESCIELIREAGGLARSFDVLESWLTAASAELAPLSLSDPKGTEALSSLLGTLHDDVRRGGPAFRNAERSAF